jgi:hypothetical protein
MEDLSNSDLIDFAETYNFPELVQIIEGNIIKINNLNNNTNNI